MFGAATVHLWSEPDDVGEHGGAAEQVGASDMVSVVNPVEHSATGDAAGRCADRVSAVNWLIYRGVERRSASLKAA